MRKNNTKKGEMSKLDSMPIHTVIGSDILFTGNLIGESIIRVEGKVEGDVSVKQGVVLGEKANINGNIKSDYAIVFGHITGNINTKGLVLKSTGIVNGDITTESIKIEIGGKYNGTLQMHKNEIQQPIKESKKCV